VNERQAGFLAIEIGVGRSLDTREQVVVFFYEMAKRATDV
jgi:hypothetical protein